MNAKRILACAAVGCCCLVLSGCGPAAVPPIPVTVGDYDRLRSQGVSDWPAGTVVTKNLTRVGDSNLTESERMASMELVAKLGATNPNEQAMLRTVLTTDPPPPPGLAGMVQEYLRTTPVASGGVRGGGGTVGPVGTRGGSGVGSVGPVAARGSGSTWPTEPAGPGGQVAPVPVPTGGTPDVDFRSARYLQLMASGKSGDLAEVVVAWAQEQGRPDEKVDAPYRALVERLTGRAWDDGLLEALNREGFSARGSAVEVLVKRIDKATLAKRIVSVQAPVTDAMRALRVFVSQFGYVPGSAQELVTTVTIYRVTRGRVEAAGELARKWNSDSRPSEDARESERGSYYQFNIRDFHLLDGLARDPGAAREYRGSLIRQLAQVLPGRRTVRPAVGVENYLLGDAVGRMTMADLWNVWLLNEMLTRNEIRTSIRKLAADDLADTSSAVGGLVTYDAALRRAEPILYRAAKINGVGDDVRYLPSRTLLGASPNSMCRWHAHFNRVKNAGLAGPTGQEMQDAFTGNYSALVLTRVGENDFCAYYYTPSRLVLSLGTFTFSD